MIERIHVLGDALKRNLDEIGYRHERFSSDVARQLKEMDLGSSFSLSELLDWTALTNDWPEQFDDESDFGQPPLTLYKDPLNRFCIDAYFWAYADTDIHNHVFSGAGGPFSKG